MSKLEAFTFFCEDVRWESNGAPMFIGVMPPTIHPDKYPLEFGRITVVTIFRSPLDVKEFSAELTLHKISGESKELIGEYGSEYTAVDIDESPFEWVAISTLHLNAISLRQRETICASLKVGEDSWRVSLTGGSPLDQTEE